MTPEMLTLAGQFGPLGLMIAYLIWRESRAEKVMRERIEADLELARSLAVLSVKIEGMR
jgi:hypothetical protein